MKRLLILGSGEYGQVAKEIAQAVGDFDKIEFLDDDNPQAVGKLCEVKKFSCDGAVVAIGNPEVRERLLKEIDKPIALVHPKATVMPSARIGEACIVEAGAVICSGATVGKGTIIMANAVVGHNAQVGEYCHLKYNATVCERAFVSDKTKTQPNEVITE